MNLNCKKIGLMALIVYAVQLTTVDVLSNIIVPFLPNTPITSYLWQAAIVLLLGAIMYLGARWYFTSSSRSIIAGFYVGVTVVFIHFVITLLQMLPALQFEGQFIPAVTAYVSAWMYWVISAVMIFAAMHAGVKGCPMLDFLKKKIKKSDSTESTE